MLVLNHKKMKAWQTGLELVVKIAGLTAELPVSEKYNLIPQLKRAALSVTSNIAEGAARRSSAERKRFYEIARSSVVEIDSCMEVIIVLGYAKREQLEPIECLIEDVFKLLSVMIRNS